MSMNPPSQIRSLLSEVVLNPQELMTENFLPCRAFLYPSDLQLELEYWAETGEYDEDELHEVQTGVQKLGTWT